MEQGTVFPAGPDLTMAVGDSGREADTPLVRWTGDMVETRLAASDWPAARRNRQQGVTDRTRGDHDHAGADLYPTGPLKPAAVLVGLVERPGGLTVLLTERQVHLKAHAGQISFPGGRLEPDDRDAAAAALREAEEEVGLDPHLPKVIGRLDTYITRTAFEVIPVVALIDRPFELRLQQEEVADAFEVPLSFIVDPANHRLRTRVVQGRKRQFFVLPYENRNIWGATAGMLVNLSEVLRATV